MIKVSFIVPSYNSFKTIGFTLESLLRQNHKDGTKEIIVVDSSNDSRTREVIGKFDGLKLIALDTKTSPAKGRNIGAQEAQGELLCFIDSDVCLGPNWLEKILEAYSQGKKVGCGSVSLPDFQENEKLAAAQLYLQFNEYLDTGIEHSRSFVPSCNLFCDRAVFESVKGFPEIRASEDTLFCLRLAGIAEIWFLPRARCFHIFRLEWDGFKKNQELLGKYVSIYRKIYYKSWMYSGIMPVILFPGFLAVKSIRIAMRLKKAGKYHFGTWLKSWWIYKLGLFYWSVGFIKGCFSDETA
jgi:glycosyltransferase involved in cell wall biosynthesis